MTERTLSELQQLSEAGSICEKGIDVSKIAGRLAEFKDQ